MGRFFTSTQIYNPNLLDREQFINFFCEEMKKDGYVTSNSDESEVSYILRFSDEHKWVTLTSEAYEQGNQLSQSDTGRIAKMLKTTCINTTVIDSDCAVLDLYDESGKKSDSLIMGHADDYLGDDIPAPAKAIWEQFISSDSKWEQFISVVQENYVFVEDGLAKLATVIEMNSRNILFEYEDANESNKNFCFLSFRKANSKKEKKLTLNATFKQVFGEELKPLGFVEIKSKHPYFVRIINGEIVHVITFVSKKIQNINSVMILGGISTVYRREIDFFSPPTAHYNYWLFNASNFYTQGFPSDYDCDYLSVLGNFTITKSESNNTLINKFRIALNDITKTIIPVLNEVKSIDNAADFLLHYSSSTFFFKKQAFDKGDCLNSNEILLLTMIEDTADFLNRYSNYLKMYNDFMISINHPKRQYDIPKALNDLSDKINSLKNAPHYTKLANEYQAKNKMFLSTIQHYE